MQPRIALGLSLGFALFGVAVVSADIAWSMTARMETLRERQWEVVAEAPPPDHGSPRAVEPIGDCATRTLRLVVDNDRRWDNDPRVLITYRTVGGALVTVLDETWRMGSGDVRTHDFTIPDSAFTGATMQDPRGEVDTVYVEARVDDLWLSACVRRST